jgi:hypothetical protein
MKRLSLLFLATAALAATNVYGVTFNVDFAPSINDTSVATDIYTIDYVGTAAAPDAGTIWNHVDSFNPAPAAFIGPPGYFDFIDGPATDNSIVDSLGNALPGVSVTINSGLGAFASGDQSSTDGDGNAGLNYISVQAQGLMREYLIANGDRPGLVTVAGLSPLQEVVLYLYGEGDNASNDRQTKFTANGVIGSTAGFAGLPHPTLVAGNDYVVLRDVFADASGAIAIKYELNGNGEAPFNGFQLTMVPEPTTAVLLGLSGLGLLTVRRKS